MKTLKILKMTLKVLKMTYGARKGKKIFAQVLANSNAQNRVFHNIQLDFYTVGGYFNFYKSFQGSVYWWKVVKAEGLTRKRLGLEYTTS